MDEELEKKVGKLVLSIYRGFLMVLSFYLISILIFISLFVIVYIPTFVIALVSLGIENITGIDTNAFRHSTSIPVTGVIWIADNLFIFLFDILIKTKQGLISLLSIIVFLGILEYRKNH